MSVDALRELYRDGRVLPFIGAGVSMSVSWTDAAGNRQRGASWKEFVDEAARQLGFTNPDLLRVRGEDIQILEYFKRKRGNLAPLSNWLLRTMSPTDPTLRDSSLHQALANLERCRCFYTTNYDDFLERSFRLHGRATNVIVTENDIAKRHGEAADVTEVVKFHGDFDAPETMVISEADYYERISLNSLLDARLRSDILGRALLFIGYSFRDWNVAYLFNLVNRIFGPLPDSPNGRRAYILVPEPSDFEINLFRARKIEVIPITGSQTDSIVQILGEMQGA